MTDREGYDPRQDEDYQEYLAHKRDVPEHRPQPQYQRGVNIDRVEQIKREGFKPREQAAVKFGNQPYRGTNIRPSDEHEKPKWDRTKQQGQVYATIQKSFENKKTGLTTYNGQVRVVVKDYMGNQFVAIESWKPEPDDKNKPLDQQLHVWSGACNVSIVDLRELASRLADLADSLDGGVSR